MKEMDTCVVMTKAELDAKVASQGEMTFGRKYNKGEITFCNGEWYVSKVDGNSCVPPSPDWKKVIFESSSTKGNQDFDSNGQPYTATNPAPVDEA